MSAAPDFSLFAGENLAVDADAISIGDASVDQTVTLEVDGITVDSTDVALPAANGGTPQQDLSLVWATDSGDVGSHTITVASNDDSASRTVEVLAQSDLSVSINNTTSPIAPGDTLDVTADITNNGDSTAVDDAILDIVFPTGGVTPADQESLAIGSGNTKTTTLQWSVPLTQPEGIGTATVEMGEASASTGVTVAEFPETQADNYWSFDEGSGSVAADSQGSFDARFGTTISWSSTGAGETYGVLDGSGGADLGSSSRSHWSHWVNNGVGGLGLWVNPTGLDSSSSRYRLFGDGTWSYGRNVQLRLRTDNSISLYVGTFSSANNTIDLEGGTAPDDEWTSVAVRADGSNAELLVNGTVVSTASVATTESGDLTSKKNIKIGTGGAGRHYDGGLDDLWSTQTDPGQQTIKDWHDKTKSNY